MTTPCSTSSSRSSLSPARAARWVLAALGVLFVGVGAVGVFVPGLPTTIFLIIAAWCFTRSCPHLERLLIRTRLFAPFLRFVDRTEPIPARTKALAIATMWTFVAFAAAMFLTRGGPTAWLSGLVVCAACVGTVVIVRWDAGLRASTRTS